MPWRIVSGLVLGTAFFWAGCSDPATPQLRGQVDVASTLRSIASCTELDDARAEVLVNRVIEENRYDYSYAYPDYDVEGAPPPAMPGDSAGNERPNDFTGTNLQEQGVDEADIVKTSGDWMYVARTTEVLVVDSWPAEETNVATTLPVQGAFPELFLLDERLIIVSQYYNYGNNCRGAAPCTEIWDTAPGMPYPDGGNSNPGAGNDISSTLVTIYDIRVPAEPVKIRSVELEGNFITTRVVDGNIYLVHSIYDGSDWGTTWKISEELRIPQRLKKLNTSERAAALDAMRPAIHQAAKKAIHGSAQQLLPRFRVDGGELNPVFGCDKFFVPASLSTDQSTLHILSLNLLANDAMPQGVGIMTSGWNTYASTNAIYVTRDSRGWSWIDNTQDRVTTDIYQFSLNRGFPTYAASGRVDGYVRDRFTMSEKDGVFRIATTDQAHVFWNGMGVGGGVFTDGGTPTDVAPPVSLPPEEAGASDTSNPRGRFASAARSPVPPPIQANNLFTLKREGNDLELIGQVRGFGVNEQIYGTRFIDDMAYVVTFRRTDPLYAIDLSDPRHPTIRGELKIPGFSNFLQSVGEGWMVGIGQDADQNGRTTGFQVQLFDVRNPEDPKRTSQLLVSTDPISYGYSEAEHESRAFTWYPSRKLLAVPLHLYDSNSMFSGLLVMHVSPEEGIREVGRVDHSSLACTDGCNPNNFYAWLPAMRRSVFIEDYLFAVSDRGFSVSKIDDLSTFLFSMSTR